MHQFYTDSDIDSIYSTNYRQNLHAFKFETEPCCFILSLAGGEARIDHRYYYFGIPILKRSLMRFPSFLRLSHTAQPPRYRTIFPNHLTSFSAPKAAQPSQQLAPPQPSPVPSRSNSRTLPPTSPTILWPHACRI